MEASLKENLANFPEQDQKVFGGENKLPFEAFKSLCCASEADEIIEQYKEHVKPIKRRLTDHITTRPYRAPEVIFLEKNYHSGVDIWATGIIIFELFKYLSMS